MSAFEPAHFSILLVGPRLSRLGPFFASGGYRTVPCEDGASALVQLQRNKFHLVCLELDLGDIESHEFLASLKKVQPLSGVMLIEDAAKTHMIVSSLVHGVDVYVPTPPDEAQLFEQTRRQCLAAAARGGGGGNRATQLQSELDKSRTRLERTQDQLRQAQNEAEAEAERTQLVMEELAEARAGMVRLTAQVAAAEAAVQVAQQQPMASGKTEELEDLRGRAEFVAFLESENDELKKERAALLARLQAMGGESDEFDEPTGESQMGAAFSLSVSADDEVSDLGDLVFSVEESDEGSAEGEAIASVEGLPAAIALDASAVAARALAAERDEVVSDLLDAPTEAFSIRSSPIDEQPARSDEEPARLSDARIPSSDIDDAEIAAILAEVDIDAESDEADALEAFYESVSSEAEMRVPNEMLAAASDEAVSALPPVRDLHDMISAAPASRSMPGPRRGRERAPAVPVARSVSTEAGFGVTLPAAAAEEVTEFTVAGDDMLRVQASMNEMMHDMSDLDDFDAVPEVTVTQVTPSSAAAASSSSVSRGVQDSPDHRTEAYPVPDVPDEEGDMGAGFADVKTEAVDLRAVPPLAAPARNVEEEADGFLDEATVARPMPAGGYRPPPIASGETRTHVIKPRLLGFDQGAAVQSAEASEDGFDIDIETSAGE